MPRLLYYLCIVLFISAEALGQTITVGSKKFTENVILAEVATQLLESQGHKVYHREQLGGTQFLWQAMLNAEIDLYADYTGTILAETIRQPDLPIDSLEQTLAKLGVGITAPLGFNNTYALGMRMDRAIELHIESISDLRDHPSLRLGFSNEFKERSDGWPSVQQAYSLPHQDVRGLDHDLSYQGLASETIDVTDLYSTDAEIEIWTSCSSR